jgi:6-phosphogluconolactonase (cycloisomerase 2 family)
MSFKKFNKTVSCFIAVSVLVACSYSIRVSGAPDDATLYLNSTKKPLDTVIELDDASVDLLVRCFGYRDYTTGLRLSRSPFTKTMDISMEKLRYKVTIDTTEGSAGVMIDGFDAGSTPLDVTIDHGSYHLSLLLDDHTMDIGLDVVRSGRYLYRPQKLNAPISHDGIYECGPLAKQVNFTPDDRFLFLALLADRGFQVFDMQSRKVVHFVQPGARPELSGYVEGLFIEEHGLYYISQMNTAMMFKYDYRPVYDGNPPKLLAEIPTQGLWSKVITYSKALDAVAVSNWSSNDVTIFDRSTDMLKARVSGITVPRGMVFSGDGRWLYVAAFEGASVHRIDTATWKEAASVKVPGSAMRHIVRKQDDSYIYVSDMAWNRVYAIDTAGFTITDTWKVYQNTNTIDLGPRDRYLYVCNRGPNAATGYLSRSPVNGRIHIIDVETGETVCDIEGGNQPTGLDVSNNGEYLAFSNFRDENFELYDISAMLSDTTIDVTE